MCYAFVEEATSRVPIPLYKTEVCELHATPLWQEPPPKSLSRYISLLGAHHSDTDAFGASYGVTGL